MSSPVAPDISDQVIELMHRYGRGEFSAKIRRRLEAIFTEYPDDAVERLERAAQYLKLIGNNLESFDSPLERQAA